jgi:hypothetical protein
MLLNQRSQFRHRCCVHIIYYKVKKITLNTSRTQWNIQIFIAVLKKKKKAMGYACGMYGGRNIHTGFWWGDQMEIAHLEDLGVDGRIILNWIFKKWNGEAWTGCSGTG